MVQRAGMPLSRADLRPERIRMLAQNAHNTQNSSAEVFCAFCGWSYAPGKGTLSVKEGGEPN